MQAKQMCGYSGGCTRTRGGGKFYIRAFSLLWSSFNAKIYKLIIEVGEVNQWHWLEESGQWFENVDPTHLVLASGKPVLQKNDTFGHLLESIGEPKLLC